MTPKKRATAPPCHPTIRAAGSDFSKVVVDLTMEEGETANIAHQLVIILCSKPKKWLALSVETCSLPPLQP